jgi:hypothetical protein
MNPSEEDKFLVFNFKRRKMIMILESMNLSGMEKTRKVEICHPEYIFIRYKPMMNMFQVR